MNLWIRSQNKIELTKVNDIKIYKASDGFQIINYSENNHVIILGLYKTKERALEVLDEIDKYKNKLEKAHFLGMEESEFVGSTFYMSEE